MCMTLSATAQKLRFSQPHGFYDAPFTTEILCDVDLPKGVTIRYTLDGSEPTMESLVYTQPLRVEGNTIVRAVALSETEPFTKVTSATYLFLDDVLKQTNTPEGYPEEWGNYTDMPGTAIADYEMDPEMTSDPVLAPKIREGLKSLPVLSILTDKDNLFNPEPDPDTGGIYIFTGPPVGDDTGHGWTRFANVELFGGTYTDENGNEVPHDMHVSCGLRLHGGHGRLAEKNPKHSFRLVFKEKYGKKTLKYPLFGEDEPHKFDQLVLRCHFGNSWQHWDEGHRTRAQYTRDVWARRIQRKMGWTSVNALYVHVFLNGIYWGLYNIAERVDEKYGVDHLGGEEEDIDVIKVEEDGGYHLEADQGTMDAYELMVQMAAKASDDTYYYQLQGLGADGNPDPEQETMLDIDAFIDYMLINQYGGNTDWDHHNWYAIRRKGADSQGFRFLCWDSEMILDSPKENVLGTDNGHEHPTGIFQNLLKNEKFARRYLKRAKVVLAEDGLLGEESAVAVFDSLYNTIAFALYDEAARWGDYRRDVHPYMSQGKLYTVDETYQKERNRLLTQYFPKRSGNVLNSIMDFVNVDEFEIPDEWIDLVSSMFHEWDDCTAMSKVVEEDCGCERQVGENLPSGSLVYGDGSVYYKHYADLTDYDQLIIVGTPGMQLRVLMNRLEIGNGGGGTHGGAYTELNPVIGTDGTAVVDLSDYEFVHLNAIKLGWESPEGVIKSLNLVKGKWEPTVTYIACDLTMTYGDELPELSYNVDGYALEGTPKLMTPATKDSPVGTYPVKIEKGTVTNTKATFVNGTLTITKAPLAVGVQDVIITEGDAIPTFTLTYSGWKNNDTEANAFNTKPTAKTTATVSSKAGVYEIAISGGTTNNYELSYTKGKLTILKKDGSAPTDLADLSKDMYHVWDGCTATSKVTDEDGGGAYNVGEALGSGNVVYGDGSVYYTHYANLTGFNTLLITGTPGTELRVLMNRLEVGNGGGDDNGGAWTELNPVIGTDGTAVVDLSGYEFVHLNAIKLGWESPEGIIESLKVSKEILEQPKLAGDANGDGIVNVFDVTAMVNYILGSPNDGFVFAAADVNGDGIVNVFDVTKVVNIILGVDDGSAKTRKAEGQSGTDKLYIEDFEIEPGEEKEVNILLNNPDAEYRDLQFDLYLPEGITVVQDEDEEFMVDKGDRCTKKHTIGFSYTDGHYVCMLYSTAKNPLTGNSGDILTITLKADGNVAPGAKTGSFRNVSLSKTDATGPTYDEFFFDITVKGADGIEDVIADDREYQIYTLDGKAVNVLQRGVNIIHYSDGTTKKVYIK